MDWFEMSIGQLSMPWAARQLLWLKSAGRGTHRRVAFHVPPVFLWLVLLLMLSAGPAEAGQLDPARLAVYYGWPSLVNGSNYNTAAATAVFGQYQVVVFGQGLEQTTHGDHANTIQIIQMLHQNYGTRVFGYMNAEEWSLYGAIPANWVARIDMWAAMGVNGIFVDRFSYDWMITREMQSGMLDAIHSRGLPAFVNGWFIDNVFSSQPDPMFKDANPLGWPSHMLATDMYLLESFTIYQGWYDVCAQPYEDADSWIEKADKAFVYHQTFGSEMWTMTTANQLTAVSAAAVEETIDPRLSYAWHATAVYGFEGMGWTEPSFSATGAYLNLLPWRTRPSPNPPVGSGAQFQNDVQHLVPLHTRDTDVGQYRVVCGPADTRTAEFVAWPVVPSLTIAGEGSAARLSWPHQAANQTYQVWREADQPYFDPDGGQGTHIADVAAGSALAGEPLVYVDDGTTPAPPVAIIGDPSHQYFWVVRGVNGAGVSDSSNRVGEFDFVLVPGQ